MRYSLLRQPVVVLTAIGTVGFALSVATPVAAAGATPSAHTLYVAPNGSDTNACTKHAPCATITHAVSVAHWGNTILVAPGTYAGTVTVTTKLDLEAPVPGVVIDATGDFNGIGLGLVFLSPTSVMPEGNASGSTVHGFTIENANQEGIVLVGNHLTITGNIATHDDLGAFVPNATGECAASGNTPGDCGEAIHLAGVTHSRISDNSVSGNTGGILVSDELGPTAWNTISHNTVVNNDSDCGITLAAHNGNAVSPTGKLQPTQGGIFDNSITDNTSDANGAAGIGFFASGPGTAVYHNVASGNRIEGNGLPGVAIHTHSADADANGNQLIGNWFSDNGLGIPAFGVPPGDPGTPVDTTVDIDVVSDLGATPITGTVIANNHIANVQTGIWLVTTGTTHRHGNTFRNVVTHLIG
jgi:parallel beta-helix repeat protein